jgi:hypothetical protein
VTPKSTGCNAVELQRQFPPFLGYAGRSFSELKAPAGPKNAASGGVDTRKFPFKLVSSSK